MKATQIKTGKTYEVTAGRNKTKVKVVKFNPKTGSWDCETTSGKTIAIKDAKRFLAEVGVAKPKKTLKETIEAKGITIIPKGRRATSTMRDLDDPTLTRKHHVNENGVLVLEADEEPSDETPKKERAKTKRADGTVSGIDGAYLVLKEAGEALNIKQIMERINEKSLCRLSGLTPSATVSAAMQRDILKHGTESRFVKSGKGLFAAR